MKVLFISHPNEHKQKPDFPSIGIAYLGAVAHDKGHDVLLIDGGISDIAQITKQTKEFAPDFIGITCWTINRGTVWELCNKLSDVLPSAFLAIGGPHASFFPDQIFIKTKADVAVIGEGETTISDLLDVVEQEGDLRQVKGIAFRNLDGTIELTGSRPQMEQIETIPFPYYNGFNNFNFKNYAGFVGLPRPTAAVITSRGCVFDCTYCGSVNFWGKKWRYRSSENVLDEMEWLVKDMGVHSIYLFDDNFPVNKKRAMDICQGILNRKLGIEWACCSHVKMINEELLAAMKMSGCMSIDFGVESGSDVILENIDKKQTRKDIEHTFALTHKFGIKPRAFLMVGNKGETPQTIDETIDLIGSINPFSSIGATLLWLLPGTKAYFEARDKGFINDSYWLSSDDVPFNTQEHTYKELFELRQRLMRGIARKKGGFAPIASYYLKSIYYRFPFLSFLRSLIPDWLK